MGSLDGILKAGQEALESAAENEDLAKGLGEVLKEETGKLIDQAPITVEDAQAVFQESFESDLQEIIDYFEDSDHHLGNQKPKDLINISPEELEQAVESKGLSFKAGTLARFLNAHPVIYETVKTMDTEGHFNDPDITKWDLDALRTGKKLDGKDAKDWAEIKEALILQTAEYYIDQKISQVFKGE